MLLLKCSLAFLVGSGAGVAVAGFFFWVLLDAEFKAGFNSGFRFGRKWQKRKRGE